MRCAALALVAASMACGGGESASPAPVQATDAAGVTAGSTGDASFATESASPGDGGTTLEVSAIDFAFEPSELSAPAGEEVVLVLSNGDVGTPHSWRIDDAIGTETVEGPSTAEASFRLDAGTYPFFCSVHPEQMTGELVVEG